MCWLTAKGGCGDPSCDDCAQEWGREKRDMTTTKTIEGRTEFRSETGTEGGHWVVMADDGLHLLRDGDRLTILDEDGEVKWRGEVELIRHPPFTEDAFGMWIHADQAGTSREEWAAMFMKEHRCVLERDE